MASTSQVNRPTDPKLRDKDIERKLQIYGIVDAFGQGKVPTNQQIDVAMNSALAWKPLQSPPTSLSREGQHLVRDLHKVIEQAKVLLLSKNAGNLIQDFTWQTRSIGSGNAQGVKAPIDQDAAKQHGNQALEDLRTLGELLITNGQFRKLLSDASILLRDIAGDAAQNAANKVNPSDEQLNQIDQAEEDNTWHDAPDLSKERFKQQAQQVQSRLPVGKEGAKSALGDATQQAHPSGTRDPATAAERDQQYGDTSGVDPRTGAKQGIANLQEQASKNMSEEDKQKLREQRERAMNYVDKKMPKERREQIIYRLKKVIVECQDHSDYQRAIESLLRLAEEYRGHAQDVGKQGVGAVQGGRDQGPVQQAETDLKTIIERFANNTSLDDVIESINQIYRDVDQDPDLRNFFKNLDNFIRKCLKTQGYVLEDRATEEYNELYRQADELLRHRYKGHTDRVADEIKHFAQQFDQDAQNKAFAASMEKLFKDLGQDANGQSTFKPHLVKDLRDVILPNLFQAIGYLPIPRIEYSDNMIDAVVENLIFEGDNLMPNVFEFGSDNYFQWARAASARQNKARNKTMLAVEGIQMDLKDVAYYVKKKEGFPSVTDKGVMDIYFGGTGISFKVAMESADKATDDAHFFKINTVKIDIDKMDIKLKQSNHKLLFNLFKPVLFKVMRPVIQKVLDKQIRDNVRKLDGMCFEAKKEADRAQAEAKRNPDPDNVKSMYQYYYEAFQRQLSKGQQKKEQAQPKGQTNIAITQHDSIFKNIKLPGGFSTTATKYKDMARQGDKWQSPVFSIGSAPESRDIPLMQTSRKPHTSTTRGTNLGTTGYTQPQTSTLGSTIGENKAGVLDPGRPAGSEAYTAGTNTAFQQTTTAPTTTDPTFRGNFGPQPSDGHTTLGKNNPLIPGNQFPGTQ